MSQMWLLPCCDITGSRGLHQKDRDGMGGFFVQKTKKYLAAEEKQIKMCPVSWGGLTFCLCFSETNETSSCGRFAPFLHFNYTEDFGKCDKLSLKQCEPNLLSMMIIASLICSQWEEVLYIVAHTTGGPLLINTDLLWRLTTITSYHINFPLQTKD